jgi:hypothetical protein
MFREDLPNGLAGPQPTIRSSESTMPGCEIGGRPDLVEKSLGFSPPGTSVTPESICRTKSLRPSEFLVAYVQSLTRCFVEDCFAKDTHMFRRDCICCRVQSTGFAQMQTGTGPSAASASSLKVASARSKGSGVSLSDAKRHQVRRIFARLIDDAGFGNPSTFGGPVAPTFGSWRQGLRYKFHVALFADARSVVIRSQPSCRRIRLDTGVGGRPGYSTNWPTRPLRSRFCSHGYNTAAIGKWHKTPTAGRVRAVQSLAERARFDYFWGFWGKAVSSIRCLPRTTRSSACQGEKFLS